LDFGNALITITELAKKFLKDFKQIYKKDQHHDIQFFPNKFSLQTPTDLHKRLDLTLKNITELNSG
jgi:hypothetical protein